MSSRAYITRLREAVAAQIRAEIPTGLTVQTSVMPRVESGKKITPSKAAGDPVCWVLDRGFRSSIETRKSATRELDVDVALYTPALTPSGADQEAADAARDAAAATHFALWDRIVAALEMANLTLPASVASSEVNVDTRYISLEVNRMLDGPSLEQHDQLVTTITLTHAISVSTA